MRILFIGGTGNISSACVAEALARGHHVCILTRGNSAVPTGCEPLVADRYDCEAMRSALGGAEYDVVINFLGFDIPELQIDFSLLHGKTGHYIFISSATVYRKPHRSLPITERHPLGNTFSTYAQKKQAGEEWLLNKHRTTGFPVTVVRPSHTYSRYWLPNVVKSAGYTFAARLRQGRPVFVPGDGSSLWTLTASTDFASALAGLMGNPNSIGEVYHITSDEALTWQEIYEMTARALGVENPDIVQIPVEIICQAEPSLVPGIKGDKAHDAVFDNSKVKELVPDLRFEKPFAAGLAEAVRWFDADDSRKQVDPQVNSIFDRVVACRRSMR